MRTVRPAILCSAIVVAFVVVWSCSAKKRCSDEELEPYRRYPCADGIGLCDKSGTIHLPPLDSKALQFVSCCNCDTGGAPSCKTCDEMGY